MYINYRYKVVIGKVEKKFQTDTELTEWYQTNRIKPTSFQIKVNRRWIDCPVNNVTFFI